VSKWNSSREAFTTAVIFSDLSYGSLLEFGLILDLSLGTIVVSLVSAGHDENV
jgi:hypothetical protein